MDEQTVEATTSVKHDNTPILFAVVLTAVFVLAGIAYTVRRDSTPSTQGCTMEALVCPDGSAVGRQGPDCSFSPCADRDVWVGTLVRDDMGFAVDTIVPSTQSTTRIRLRTKDVSPLLALVGAQVSVRGVFVEGALLDVAYIERLADAVSELPPGLVGVTPASGQIGTLLTLEGGGIDEVQGVWIEDDQGSVGYLARENVDSAPTGSIQVRVTDQVCSEIVTDVSDPCTSWLAITPGVYLIRLTRERAEGDQLLFTVEETEG